MAETERKKAQRKAWVDAHPNYYRDYQKAWEERNKDKVRATQRKFLSGWTQEQFNAAWVEQGGCCDICGRPMLPTGTARDSVAADHDHNTLRRRGLLHNSCNRALGQFRDDTAVLEGAIAYLKKHSRGGT